LELNPEKVEDMQASINKVLDWMEALNAIDTSGVEPLVHMTSAMNHFREDVAKQESSRDKALALGPDVNEAFFKVPQVIE
jgi:aspartyl-tRNA(Asn)/glutamyl-tRNA(Gln) amidotransferase subunit C